MHQMRAYQQRLPTGRVKLSYAEIGGNFTVASYSWYNEMSAKLFTQHLPTFDFLTEFRTIQVQSIAEYSDLLNAAQLIDVNSKLDLLHYEERISIVV